MNRVADAMEPYLLASGIDFGRNDPGQTLSQAIALSNAGGYGLHLAIHSMPRVRHWRGRCGGGRVLPFGR